MAFFRRILFKLMALQFPTSCLPLYLSSSAVTFFPFHRNYLHTSKGYTEKCSLENLISRILVCLVQAYTNCSLLLCRCSITNAMTFSNAEPNEPCGGDARGKIVYK